MCMLPSSQYGSVADLPSFSVAGSFPYSVVATRPGVSPSGHALVEGATTSVTVNSQAPSTRDVRINSDLSALSIRATEYLQRWKEVVQFSSKDYSDQDMSAHPVKEGMMG